MGCKWCGRDYNGGTSAGGWSVCSERCRAALSESITDGTSVENPNALTAGALWKIIKFFSVMLILYSLLNLCSDGKGRKKSSARTRHQSEHSDEQVSNSEVRDSGPSNSSASNDEAESNGISLTETAASSQTDESNSSTEAAAGGSASATERAEEMLRNTSYRYSTKDIMNETGLSRKEVKRIRRNL